MFPIKPLAEHKDAAAGHVGGSQDAANRAIVATCLKAGTRAALIWIGVVIVGLLGMSLIAAQLANGG